MTYAGADALHDVEVTPPLWAFHQLWRDRVTGSARGKRALAAFCAMTRPLLAVVALAILKAPMAQAAMRRSLAPPEEIEPSAPRRSRCNGASGGAASSAVDSDGRPL